MGATLSTLMLLAGSLVIGVLSSVAGYYSKSSNAEKTRLWNGIAAGIGVLLALLTLFIMIKGHSAAEGFEVGVMISFVLLMIAMIIATVLNVLSLIEAGKVKSNSTWFSTGAAIAAFGSFLLSLVLIIFLL